MAVLEQVLKKINFFNLVREFDVFDYVIINFKKWDARLGKKIRSHTTADLNWDRIPEGRWLNSHLKISGASK